MSGGFDFEPRIIGFLCNWCCYAGADLAGVSRYQYPTNMRVIRVMCSGRVDLSFIFRSFLNRADAVFMGGCWPGECHYVTEGNYYAISMVQIAKNLLEYIGLNPERLRLEWVSASEGIRFAEVMRDFTSKVKELGPIGEAEGLDSETLKFRLSAVNKLVPYIKLVERERLRVNSDNEEEYYKFFESEDVERIFKESIYDKLSMTQIALYLRENGPQSIDVISQGINFGKDEVSSKVQTLLKQGILGFDESSGQVLCYDY